MLKELLKPLTKPVVDFLKQEGAWEDTVSIYTTVKEPASDVISWFNFGFSGRDVLNLLFSLGKIILQILVVTARVLIDIVQWIIQFVAG